jgi:3-oxoacyl-[acyl-carrier protein] reductase
MVSGFADLIGDHSALHVSNAFARRSVYRQPVVHGMLPVAFVSLLDGLRVEGLLCALRSISGRFISPVYTGDLLELRADLAKEQASTNAAALNYQVESLSSGKAVTVGSMTVSYRTGWQAPGVSSHRPNAACLLTAPLAPLQLRPEDISKGRSESFEFMVTEGAISSLIALLAEGTGEDIRSKETGRPSQFHYPNLLAVLLLSTMVGMRLPGNSATFLEFSAEFDREVEPRKPFRLEGTVSHMSGATKVVRTAVSAVGVNDQAGKQALRGKVSALVNRPPGRMPTMSEMKDAVDLGLKDKSVLITGSSRGIGEAIAKLLALFGARIVINYHRGKEDAARIVSEIEAVGGTATAIQADVTNSQQVHKMVAEAVSLYGPVHVLVNNAVRNYKPIAFLDLTWDEVQQDLDVIAKGAFNCCREVIPFMLTAGGGKIINISSVAVEDPPPSQAKYVLAKSALVGLTRCLSIEFAARNILVNLVVPNFVETDLVSHIPEGFRKKMAQDTPMQRSASPVDVAQAVLFLASRHASFTTGQKIMVTGGGAPYL